MIATRIRHILRTLAIVATLLPCTTTNAWGVPPDDDDYDESIRRPIRRLHPEREREKAIKKWQKEQEQKQKEEQARQQAEAEEDPQRKLIRELLSIDFSIDSPYVAPANSADYTYEPYRWIDEPVTWTAAEILPLVATRSRTDGSNEYLPKGVNPDSRQSNAVFLHFAAYPGGMPGPLYLGVLYYADDPLRFERIVFTADGYEYDYRPQMPHRGKAGSRMYWESSDEPLGPNHRDMVYAITHCQWCTMRLVGADGIDHMKTLTDSQLADLANILRLYLALGGKL